MKKKKILKIIDKSLEKLGCKKRPQVILVKNLYLSDSVCKFSKVYYSHFIGESNTIKFYYPFFRFDKHHQKYAVQYSACIFFDYLLNGSQTTGNKRRNVQKIINRLTSYQPPNSVDISKYNLKDSFYKTLKNCELDEAKGIANYSAIVKGIHKVEKIKKEEIDTFIKSCKVNYLINVPKKLAKRVIKNHYNILKNTFSSGVITMDYIDLGQSLANELMSNIDMIYKPTISIERFKDGWRYPILGDDNCYTHEFFSVFYQQLYKHGCTPAKNKYEDRIIF